jgi:hypothetical protein
MDSLQVKKTDLITLIKLAQTDSDSWTDSHDQALGHLCKKFNNIHIERPALDGEFTSRVG